MKSKKLTSLLVNDEEILVDPDILEYEYSVSSGSTSIPLTATIGDSDGALFVNDSNEVSGVEINISDLSLGNNIIEIRVHSGLYPSEDLFPGKLIGSESIND